MSAEIIDFAKKKKERELKKLLETDLADLSDKDLKKFTVALQKFIVSNATSVSPSSMPGHITVMIDGMAYIIKDYSSKEDFE